MSGRQGRSAAGPFPEDLEFVLGGSPDPFASDPEPKKQGMSAFQPDALTISRGDLWAQRRQFADAVLEPGKPLHSLAKNFVKVAGGPRPNSSASRSTTTSSIAPSSV